MKRGSDRLEKQRLRQREVRDRNRALKRPSRDDFARMLLHLVVEENVQRREFKTLDQLQDRLVRALALQGFDKRQGDLVFEDLIDRYKQGWTFARKVHLLDTGEE